MPAWSEEEKLYLRENYDSKPIEDIKDRLSRSKRAIESKASRMGVSKVGNWSDEEVSYLLENYEDTWNDEIADEIGRSKSAVYNKAYKLGLKSDRTLMRRSDIVSSDIEPPIISDYERGFLCGLVCGEGSFVVREERNDKKSFSIDIMMKEEHIIREVKDLLECGSVYRTGDFYSYTVRDIEALWNKVIPVFDNCNFMKAKKEEQYKGWKKSIIEYYDL